MKNYTLQSTTKASHTMGRMAAMLVILLFGMLQAFTVQAQSTYTVFSGSSGGASVIQLNCNDSNQTYVDNGWIRWDGYHDSGNNNYYTGYMSAGVYYRSFFAFTNTVGTVTSASITMNTYNVSGSGFTVDYYAMPDYTVAQLDASRGANDATGMAIFNAIGTGTYLGSSISGFSSNQVITTSLNVAALNAMGSSIRIVAKVDNFTGGYTAPVLTTSAASSVTTTSATFNGSITPNSNSGNYYYQYGTSGSYGSTTTSRTYNSSSSNLAEAGIALSAGTTYYYRLYATVSGHTDVTGSQVSFSTPPAVPTITPGSTTTICNGSGTTLTATGGDGTVYWYTGNSCSGTAIGTGTSITVYPTSTTIYTAKNYKNSLYSSCSSQATVTVNEPATVPLTAVCSSTTESTAALSWGTSTGTGTVSYKWVVGTSSSVVYGTVGAAGVAAQGITTAPTVAATATGLTASTGYYLRVLAYTSSPCTESGYRTSGMFTTVPLAPVASAATAIRANSFSANWAAATGATKYFLDVSTSATFTSFISGYENKDVGNVVTYSITGLNNTTTYYYRVRAYNDGGTGVSSSPAITVLTLPVNNFLIEKVGGGDIPEQLAGTAFSVKITARDAFNTTVSDYTGTAAITSNSTLTEGGTTLAFSAGVLTSHSVTLSLAGAGKHLTAAIGSPAVSSNSNDFTVTPANINYFTLAVNGTVTAGTAFTVTATVYDEFDNIKTNYEGPKSVNWTTTATSSPNGTARIIPANGDQTFVAGVATIGGFTFFNADQSQLTPFVKPTITITDAPTSSPGTTLPITVLNAPLANFKVVAGTVQSAGAPFSTTVTARDIYWNTCVDYAGSIRFKSSDDALVTFPAGLQSFAPASTYLGVRTFTNEILINVMGAYWLRAADAAFAYKSGQQENIVVGPGAFSPLTTRSTLTISDPLTPLVFVDPLNRVAGEYVLVTATPRDALGNLLYACRDISIYLNGVAMHRNGSSNASIGIPVTNVGDGSYTALVRVSLTGTNLITASFNDYNPDEFFDQVRTVLVSPAPVDLAHTLITADPSTMTTDEHSDITVQLKDVFDNNRTTSDGTVTLETTKGVLTGGITDNTNGTYSSVLNGNYGAVGTALITGKLDGSDITDTESVTITEGLPALATIEITANPEIITTNQNSTISVQLKDQFGNLITTDRGIVVLSSTLGALSSVTYTTAGIYTSTLSGYMPGFGDALITGTYNTGAILDNATVTFNQGYPDLAHITITASPVTMTSDESSAITVQLKDEWGNLFTTSRGTVTLSSTLGALTVVTDHADGTYTATLTGDYRGFGNATITGKLDGSDITDNAIVTITEGKPDLADITITPASGTMTTDETRLITVQMKDQFGNNLTTSRGTVTLFTSLTGTALNTVTDHGNGTYSATLSTTVTGTATITGHLADSPDGIDGDITDSAEVIITEGKPALAMIEITASPTSITTDEISTITIQLKDQWGNNLSTQRGTVELTAVSKGAISEAIYQTAGYYTATLSGDARGVGTTLITGVLTDVADGVSGLIEDNAEVTFTEGLPSLAISDISVDNETITTDGSSTITVQLKDQFGNLIVNERGTVTLTSTIGLLSAVSYITDGIYTATLNGDTRGINGTGTSVIFGSFAGTGTAAGVNGDFTDGASVIITEGLPSLLTTIILADPTTMTVDETSTITVQLKDQFGNLIVNDRSTVELSTTLGVLTAGVSYTGAGIYTATLYGNNTGVGTATITGTLAGEVEGNIEDDATVEITEGLPSLATTTITPAFETMTTDETDLITVQLKDQFGNLIINNRGTVELSATIGSLTAVSYAGAGTYTATLSGDTRGTNGTGTSLITGTFNTLPIALNASVIITEGLPDLVTSTFDAVPTTITTDETSLITVQLKDHLTNNITHSRGTVALSTDLGELTEVADNEDGTYTATLSANNTNTGIATISGSLTGTVNGTFTDEVEVTITEGLPNLAQILITADPTSITADQNSTLTVQLKDQWGNNLTNSRGSISLSSANLTGTSISSVIDNNNGTYTATFSMISYGTGSATITGIFTGTGTAAAVRGDITDNATIAVSHGVATKLAMLTQPSSTATAGVVFEQQPVVRIQDQFSNLVSSDITTVLTVSRSAGTDVLKGTLTATAVNGVATFTDLYYTKAETITLGFTSSPVLTGVTSSEIVVGHAPIDHFTLSAPANFTAGSARVAYTVTRWDLFENLVTTGAQSTYLYSSSNGANKKFYSASSGGSIITSLSIADGASTANFWYYDEKTGDHTITASDNSSAPDGDININDGTDQITVTPALLKDFIVYGIENPHDLGTVRSVTVEPRDTYNNRKTNYIGTITFSNTDLYALNPADYHFLSADLGIRTFSNSVLFSQPGSWWLTAIDLAEPTKYGAQADIIVQRAVSIVANDRSKTYGDVETLGAMLISNCTVTGIVPGVNPVDGEITGITLASTGSVATASVAGSTYPIVPSLATGTYNPTYYRIVYSEAGQLTVNPATLAITANEGQTKVYGEADPTPFTYTASGFKNDQTVSIMTGSLDRVAGEYVNTYAIGQGSLYAGSNYTISYTADNFSITKKPVTVIATAGKSKVYGQLDPTFDYTTNVGLAFSDVFVGALARTSGEDVATNYALNIGSLSIENGSSLNVASNYTISFTTADFAITQLALAVTADAQSKTYGDIDPALTFVSVPSVGTVLANGHLIAFTGALSRATGEDVGAYAINKNTVANSNYAIIYTGANMTIGQLAVAVNADAKSKTYGDVDPALTFVSVPSVGTLLANGHQIAFTGELSRATGEDVGAYAIGKNTVANSNYAITYTGANLTIGQLAVAVYVDAKSKTYGDVDPALTFVSSPAVGHELANGLTIGFSGSLSRTPGETVLGSPYAINQSNLANDNYAITYTGANLTIGQLAVAVNVDAKSKTYGDVDPALTFVSSPAVGHELANGLTIGFSGSLSRDEGETVLGSPYAINQSTLANSNFAITFTGANLTIGQLAVAVNADTKSKTYGDVDPALTFVSVPSVGSALANGLTIGFTGALTRAAGETVLGSPYAISQSSVANSNYTITYTGANLTIGALTVYVDADAKSKTYGNADPVLTFVSSPVVGTVLANSEVIGFTGALSRATGESVLGGPYAIGQNTVANSNYAISFTGAYLTINTRPITLTATNRTKTYGDLLDLGNTQFGITGDGMAYSETISTVELTSLGTPVPAHIGPYAITTANAVGANGYLVSNYNVTYSSAGTLTIGVRTLHLSSFAADSKTYDGNTVATGIGFIDDRLTGDVLSFQRDAAFDTKDVGVNKPVYYTNIAITGGSDMLNYVLASTTGTAYASIFAKNLTVTANNDSELYTGVAYSGGNGVTYSGFISGEDASVLTGTLTYGGNSQGAISAGTYDITPGGYTPVNYTYTYVDGTLSIFESLSVSGTFKYYNTSLTPLNNVKVELWSVAPGFPGVPVAKLYPVVGDPDVVTNSSGEYSFANVSSGSYIVVATTNKSITYGTYNSSDALGVYNWAFNFQSLEKVRFYAGDVSLSNRLASVDASRIMNNFTSGGTLGWLGRGNWTFWTAGETFNSNQSTSTTLYYPEIVVAGSSITKNFYGLATGDFNLSGLPGNDKSLSQSLALNHDLVKEVETGDIFTLPVNAGVPMEVGAVSLIMNFPSDKLEILGVYLGNDENSPVSYGVEGDVIRIGWYSGNPVSLRVDEKLLTIKVRVIGSISQDETLRFELNSDPLNELADGSASIIDGALLKMDLIGGKLDKTADLLLANYPNPFRETTTFTYSIPADGKVTLEICSILGGKVKVLIDEAKTAGDYSFEALTADLNPGIYTATLRVSTNQEVMSRTIKIICKQ